MKNAIQITLFALLLVFAAIDGYAQTYYSRDATAGLPAGSTWSYTGTWSTTGHNGVDAGSTPTASNVVRIAGGHKVIVGDNTTAASSFTLLGGPTYTPGTAVLEFIEEDASNLGTVTGNGILRFKPATATTPTMPSLFDDDFLCIDGSSSCSDTNFLGTIEFTGGQNYTLPNLTEYYNLIISGTSTKTLANTIEVEDGYLTISSGTLDMSTFLVNGSTATTMTMAASTNLISSNSFPTGFTTYTLDATAEVKYQRNTATGSLVIPSTTNYPNLRLESTAGAGVKPTFELNNAIIIEGDFNIGQSLIFQNGANDNITIKGDWIRDTGSDAGSASVFNQNFFSTVFFSGTSQQQISVLGTFEAFETFVKIDISNAAGVQVISQTAGNNGLAMDYLYFSSTTPFLDLQGGTLSMIAGGDIINNSTHSDVFDNASTVLFNNTSFSQEVRGSMSTTFNNLTLEKAAGFYLLLSQDVTVNGALTMNNDGKIELNSVDLTMSNTSTLSSGSGSFSATRMIDTSTGHLIHQGVSGNAASYDFIYPIGIGSDYTPVTINASVVADIADGTISLQAVADNSNLLNALPIPALAIKRFFKIDMANISSLTAAFDFKYVDGDIQGNEASYEARYHDGTDYINPSNSFVTAGTNTFGSTGFTLTDVNTEWICGEPGAFNPPFYYSRTSGQGTATWNNVNSWTYSADGSGNAVSAVPGVTADVEILSTHTISVATNGMASSTLKITGNLIIDDGIVGAGLNFGKITGTGTLTLNTDGGTNDNTPVFNGGTSTFFDTGGGKVIYGGSFSNGSVLGTYNDLEISNSVTFTNAGDITVNGNFYCDNSRLTISNTSTLIVKGDIDYKGGSAGGVLGGDLELGGSIANGGGQSWLFFTAGKNLTLNGTSAQTIVDLLDVGWNPISITNLNLSGSGTKTSSGMAIGFTVDGTMTLASGTGDVTFDVNDAVVLNGDLTGPSTGPAINVYDLNGGMQINNNVNLSGKITLYGYGATAITFANTPTIAGDIVVDGQIIANNGMNISSSSSFTVNPGSWFQFNGIITTSTTGLLIINMVVWLDNTTQGNESTSYIDGPMKKIGNEPFTFPLGNGGVYARLGIDNLTGGLATEFTAEYSALAYSNTTSVTSPLIRMSGGEYWNLSNAGTSNADVTLYWENNGNSGIDDSADLGIAHYNGSSSSWEDLGQSAISYAANGNITVTGVSSFSPFAFGSKHATKNPLKNAPLPIELLFLNATSGMENVELHWATATELNNDHFEVERSTDADGFIKIGTIKGNGTTNETLHYRFTDDTPFSGINYYRLKQVDYDGTFEYSDIVSVESNFTSDYVFEVIPNPTTEDNITVRILNQPLGKFQLQLFDIHGKLYYQKYFESVDSPTISIETDLPLKDGVYFMNLVQNGKTMRQKLVVNN